MKITISGLAACGKGTVAKLVAEKLQIPHIDIGLLFRIFTHRYFDLGSKNVCPDYIHCLMSGACNCELVKIIRSEQHAKKVALLAGERLIYESMREFTNTFLKKYPDLICDGRNAGLDILTEADYKFFLTADIKTRAMRRKKDSPDISLPEVEKLLSERDSSDSNRAFYPCCAPKDVFVIDTSGLTATEVSEKIVSICSPNTT